jgi:hypothetical protein
MYQSKPHGSAVLLRLAKPYSSLIGFWMYQDSMKARM